MSVGYSENAPLVGGVLLSVSADGSLVHGGGGNAGIGCRGVGGCKRSVVAVCPEGGSARKSQPAMQSFLSTDMAFDIA